MRYYPARCAPSCRATKLGALTWAGIAWLLLLLLVDSIPALSSEPTQATNPSQGQPARVLRADQSEPDRPGHPILSARTVCVVGEFGTVVGELPDRLGPNPASAKKQVEKVLRKWGRFTLVEDPEQADVVLVVVEGTKEVTYSREDPAWWQSAEKTETRLVDTLLVFKGGKVPKADLAWLRLAYMRYGITFKGGKIPMVPPVDATAPLLWDSGEDLSTWDLHSIFVRKTPANAKFVAIKFRKFVERLEKRKPK
jgi:hypothetical protein